MRWGNLILSTLLTSVGIGLAYAESLRDARERSGCCPQCAPAMWHLFEVGETKALGYLDLETIRENGHEPEALAQELRQRGLRTMFVEPSPDRFDFGALYVYDERALGELLAKHVDILRDAGWPEDVETFVDRVANVSADPRGEMDLYRLIGVAFNDQRFV